MVEQSGFLARQTEAQTGGGAPGAITVALVNAMSDAALAITERRFSRLLHAALPGCDITLRCVTLPEIARGEMAAARIARYYTSLADIVAAPPDAVIFSGAEPSTPDLHDEAFWPSLAALFDWVRADQIPSLFSCLAAHAAVLHFSGIRRHRVARKVFGLFEQSQLRAHAVLRGLPDRFPVAHSRWNELDAAELADAGYTVLTGGPQTEVDMFVPQNGAPHLFLQGHPEYEETALEGEYRRDLRRFALGETVLRPEPPQQAATDFAAGDPFANVLVKNWISPSQEMTQ
jgi:homoserine O-succinyltransferase